jgi:hypothetical protein
MNLVHLALPSKSLTCNESIDDVELVEDGDEVHSPIVAQKGRLLHKRKMYAVEKATVKKSQRKSNEPC